MNPRTERSLVIRAGRLAFYSHAALRPVLVFPIFDGNAGGESFRFPPKDCASFDARVPFFSQEEEQ